jgi:hypothetical protein
VRSRLLSNAFEMLFEEMKTMPYVTPAMIDEPIRAYFQSCLNRSLEHTQTLPADPFADVENEIAYLHRSVAEMQGEMKRQSFRHSVVQDATELLQQSPRSTAHSILRRSSSPVTRCSAPKSRMPAPSPHNSRATMRTAHRWILCSSTFGPPPCRRFPAERNADKAATDDIIGKLPLRSTKW